MEYTHAVDLPDNWVQERVGYYVMRSPVWADLMIRSQILPIGYTTDQFFQLVQYDIWRNWSPSASQFEITEAEIGKKGGQPSARIRYRVQESSEYCVVVAKELVVVSRILQGHPHGFRVTLRMCERDVAQHGGIVESILDSFEVTLGPATYYSQFMSAKGVTVKAAGEVDAVAVEAGVGIVAAMLSGRNDIARCMVEKRAELAIVPKDQLVTSLPEYANLEGTRDFTGRSRDSFDICGLGAVPGQPVSSAGEEQLLGHFGPNHPYYPFRGQVAVHEFAHGIQNLCFTPGDHEKWKGLYEKALNAGLYPGTHMMADVYEFFAVLSTVYFGVTDELGQGVGRDTLKTLFPEAAFLHLDEIYGGAILPYEYRTRLKRP